MHTFLFPLGCYGPKASIIAIPCLKILRACLVMEFKNYCLKWCENCDLKSVVEKCVFSVYKLTKCVWYHGLNNMFQCSKNIKLCLVCVCLILKKADTCTKYQFFNSGERIHLIVLLLLCVCSFLFLLFPFFSLRVENKTHTPHLHWRSPLIHN